MPLYKANDILEKKLRAVKTYLETGRSLRKIASEFDIPFTTLNFWVKLYKEGGKQKLAKRRVYRKRIPKSIERKIMYLKEKNPALSINRAQQILKKQGIIVSLKGIWNIWKRYGLSKRPIEDPINLFGIATPESIDSMLRAKNLIRQQRFTEAAYVINSLPSLPDDPIIEVIKKIPEKILSPRRRLDRLVLEFNEIPFPHLRNKAHRTAKLLERRGYIYSSIIANFMEVIALDWMGKHIQKASLLALLASKMKSVKDNALWFYLYFHQTTICCKRLQVRKALEYVKKCRRLVYVIGSPHYHEQFGNLLTFPGKYKEARFFYEKALEKQEDEMNVARLNLKIANFGHNMAGEYREAKEKLTKAIAVKDSVSFSSPFSLGHAYISYGQGNLTQATNHLLESLKKASKGELHNLIYATSMALAAVAMALDKKAKAKSYLSKYLPLLKKHSLLPEVTILKQLQGSTESIPEQLLHTPLFRLLYLLVNTNRTLKIGDYRRAFRFAQQQQLLGFFHRWIVFFPCPVIQLLEKGKQTGLPRTLLRFPLFNQKSLVYHIKFLGDVVITRHGHYLSTKPSPQEKALLIHLALRAGSPKKFILLRDLYQNFWSHSKNPSGLLLHVLANIKRKLRIPSHLLTVSSTYAEPRLNNRGIYFTTDYDELETLLVQVKSLEKAGERSYAKRDYLRAFRLLRGEPFKKMYDHWSETMRGAILNQVEEETVHFATGYSEQGNRQEVKKLLTKIAAIVPHSSRIKNLITSTNH